MRHIPHKYGSKLNLIGFPGTGYRYPLFSPKCDFSHNSVNSSLSNSSRPSKIIIAIGKQGGGQSRLNGTEHPDAR